MQALKTSSKTMLNKVPEATLIFWIIKMMSTTVGETAADYLNVDLNFGLTQTSITMFVLLLITLFFQIRARYYKPALYWMAVVFISVFGTLVTDNLTDSFGIPLAVSTIVFSSALLATFIVWYSTEKTLSIASINTTQRELFYWLAIFLTFSLGTALGDWIAEGLGIGYANAAFLFGAMIGLTGLFRFAWKANAIACFWVAYILTRPFGAACGDLLSQPQKNGGFGLGTVSTSIVFLAFIIASVAYLSFSQRAASEKNPT